MDKQVTINYRSTEEYHFLVEECQSTLTERVTNSRMELIYCYGEIGEIIYKHPLCKKFGKGNRKFLDQLFQDIGIGISNGYYCLQFYEQLILPNGGVVSTAMETLFSKEGKNISWNKIKTQYLPAPKEQKIKLPKGKYSVIYADPPWKYNDEQNTEILGGAIKHYPVMSIKELCDMEIPSTENAVLFLWVTSPLLEESFEVINSWGFKYKASFVWDKVKHNMGHYNSVRHEFLLVCTKGSMTPEVLKLFDSVIVEEKTKKHSEKPMIVYEIIETLYPSGKYLELFARRKRNNWRGWGNENI